MELTITYHDSPYGGTGYRIRSADGMVNVLQNYKPGADGYQVMTQAEAEAFATAEAATYQTPVEPTEPAA